jgi:hypothetical protein
VKRPTFRFAAAPPNVTSTPPVTSEALIVTPVGSLPENALLSAAAPPL